jgi:hypothetical protein
MSKPKTIALTIIITLFLTATANAKTESFIVALGIVESFDIETQQLIKKEKWSMKSRGFYKTTAKQKKEATNDIKSARWSEGPSPKRFSRLYKIVDLYTTSVVEAAEDLASNLGEKERGQVDDAVRKLTALRVEFLEELKKTSASEVKPSRQQKPNPVIDRSPYEERPGDRRGLFER